MLEAAEKPPAAGLYLWNWFTDITNTCRQTGGMGIARLTRDDIRGWERDEFVRLQNWERRVILRIDDAYIAQKAADAEARAKRDANKGAK